MKAHQLVPGHIFNGRLIIATDPDKPFMSVQYHRFSGGGRETFRWEQDVLVDGFLGADVEVVDAEVIEAKVPMLHRGGQYV